MQTVKAVIFSLLITIVLFAVSLLLVGKLFELNFYTQIRHQTDEFYEDQATLGESLLYSIHQKAKKSHSSDLGSALLPLLETEDPTLHMAFLVKEDGTLLAHSDSTEKERISGNIAADEFTYNLEQIYYTLTHDFEGVYTSPYYIVDLKPDFSPKELELIKTQFDRKADKNGILLTQKTILKDGTLCTANVILSKAPLYGSFTDAFARLSKMKLTILVLSFLFSAVLFVIFFLLLKSGNEQKVQQLPDNLMQAEISSKDIHEESAAQSSEIKIHVTESEPRKNTPKVEPVIQDAIPIRKKRSR